MRNYKQSARKNLDVPQRDAKNVIALCRCSTFVIDKASQSVNDASLQEEERHLRGEGMLSIGPKEISLYLGKTIRTTVRQYLSDGQSLCLTF